MLHIVLCNHCNALEKCLIGNEKYNVPFTKGFSCNYFIFIAIEIIAIILHTMIWMVPNVICQQKKDKNVSHVYCLVVIVVVNGFYHLLVTWRIDGHSK